MLFVNGKFEKNKNAAGIILCIVIFLTRMVRFDKFFVFKSIKICCVSSLDKTNIICYDIKELVRSF